METKTETTSSPNPPSKRRPWAGVIFSLFIPGFGFARAGHFVRAAAWLVGLQLWMVLALVLLALEPIPFLVGVGAVACGILAWLAMLYQSYQPGRMTPKLWASFLVLCLLALAFRSPAHWLVHPFAMPTSSMSPTLQGNARSGDHFLVDRLTYKFSSPRRGDLLVFRTAGIAGVVQDQIFVKRLVGMPGEQLEIRDGFLYANRTRLTEKDRIPAIHYIPGQVFGRVSAASNMSYEVSRTSYFVIGDNPSNSLDSRYFGSIPSQNVYGKATAIYYPFSRAGRPRYTAPSDDEKRSDRR